MFFNLFIKSLEIGISSEVAKFTDNTKLFQVVKTKSILSTLLQEELFKQGEQAAKWQMHYM